jgi:glutamine synthetase
MVASSMSIGSANTVLNTIVADVFSEMADELEKASNFDLAVHDLIKKTLTDHQRIVFNGNGYAEAWVEEAARRGLPNITSMVEAIPALVTEKAIKMFEKHHVFSAVELHSRAEIQYEAYAKAINIEAKTMISMVNVKYFPAIISYARKLADSINAIKAAVPDADISVPSGLLKEISAQLAKAQVALKTLQEVTSEAAAISEIPEMAKFYKSAVVPAMAKLRAPIDVLELIVDKEIWPVPTYGDLLFEV